MIISLTPGLLYILGAAINALLPKSLHRLFVIGLPAIALLQLTKLSANSSLSISGISGALQLLRVDPLSMTFGWVFVVASLAGFIYGLSVAKKREYTAALVYIGSALSVIFAGDLLTLYIFWELMAISSVFLVLLSNRGTSRAAGLRYIIVHIVGGLVLLAGIIMHVHATGSLAFDAISIKNTATWLMLIGMLVNAAAFPFSSWLSDAYPESTIMGGVILSAFTTKTAVYTLLRAFPGWDTLIWVGVVMAIFGVLYAVFENNIRRILAFSIINQGGFMVCAVGIGSPLAIAGSAAHAFCCIVYTALLWMAAGAVIHRTGKHNCSELGGLYRYMPLTTLCAIIGALAIAAAPFASGFTSKMLILKAAKMEHLFWPWLGLELASVGVVFHAGLRFILDVFFGKDCGLKVNEAPRPMLLGMGICALITVYIGLFPELFYTMLPFSDLVMNTVPHTFYGVYIKYAKNVVTQWELLLMAVLAFFIIRRGIQPSSRILRDADWVYRRLLRYVVAFVIGFIDFIYNLINRLAMDGVRKLSSFFQTSIPTLLYLVNAPIIRSSNLKVNKFKLMDGYDKQVRQQAFPFTVLGAMVFVVFIALYLLIN
jgi:multicomponent Na+:H+ antiporter subunit D